jgi:hypothetical protein
MPSAPSDKHLAHFGTVGTGPYDLAPQLNRPQSHVVLLENFFDEFRRKVPVSGKRSTGIE